jgi:Ca2+-binding RTX toxin-like protein
MAVAAADEPSLTLVVTPATAAPGAPVVLTVTAGCKDGDTAVFSIKGGGYDDVATGICSVLAYRAHMTAPTVPGSYVAVAELPSGETPKALLTVSAASGATVCEQAIAEAGTGSGAFGDHQLVFAPDRGGSGDDVVVGTDGDDRLSGGAGNDVLCGGAGADELSGGSGDDVLYGEAGDDRLLGGSGDDVLNGGDGIDALFGGSGDDIHLEGEQIQVGSGDDFIPLR